MKRILIAVIAVTSLIFGALIFLNLCGYTPQLALVPKSDSDVTYYIPPQLPTPSLEVAAYTPPQETPQPSVPEDDEIVYRGKSGECYHRETCRTLKNGAYPIKKSAAVEEGRTACYFCNPDRK